MLIYTLYHLVIQRYTLCVVRCCAENFQFTESIELQMQKGAANKEDRRRKMTGKKKKDKDEEDKEETGDTNADK